jgi:hypothetical protein
VGSQAAGGKIEALFFAAAFCHGSKIDVVLRRRKWTKTLASLNFWRCRFDRVQ